MFKANQFKQYIIEPALKDLVLYSEAAVNLLMFTMANESLGGKYLVQIKGPALGVYQMEPATYNDIWQNYIMKKSEIYLRMIHAFGISSMPPEDRMIYDLRFATAMARIHYARVPQPLPDANDIDAIWGYYKQHYNTQSGAAVEALAKLNYEHFLAS